MLSNKNSGNNQTFDTLLKLLPSLFAAYPAFMSLLGENGLDWSRVNDFVTALPVILDKIKNAEPEQLERLFESFTEVFPGLEEVLPR
ncbi:MAG: hypothetical protein GX205_05155 [Firmicutes bacterium]|nr:hypothetical protein [Bacillota bacterium]